LSTIDRKIVFPFTAIVGREKAKLALLCCAVDPTIGGVLLSGEKGTGKSTLVRALSQVLPEIEVVDGCPFNCNPHNPLEMCDSCYSKLMSGVKLKVVKRKMKVVDLPLSITVDRLIGTIDIKRAIKEGIRTLQPGLLAEANRNILYIDEVNLLDDYVADVLLDAAAMGWNIIEREGISFRHPARFILVGSMNPEEGELRPQLLDRFGLYVKIEALNNPEDRVEIVRRVEEFHADPISFYKKFELKEEELRKSIIRAKELVRRVEIDDDLLKLLIETVIKLNIRTHRAEIVTVKTAKAIAALNGRLKVNLDDLKKAMELALPHRLKSKPLQQVQQALSKQISKLIGGSSKLSTMKSESAQQRSEKPTNSNFKWNFEGDKERVFEALNVTLPLLNYKLKSPKAELTGLRGSRRYRVTVIGYPQGHPVTYALPFRDEHLIDVDVNATINAAAIRLRRLPIEVDEQDLRVKVRKHRAPKLSVILLDSSGSMGVMRRMSIAKGIAQKLIEQSYINRDYVALIAFRGKCAELVVPPTRNYLELINAISKLPTGGRTPLPSALQLLIQLVRSFKLKNRSAVVKGILITDGKANVPLRKAVRSDIEELSIELARRGIELEIHDTRPPTTLELSPSYIELIAELTNAKIYHYH